MTTDAVRPPAGAGTRVRPGRLLPTGAESIKTTGPQARVEIAWLKVADGRMTAAAFTASGW